MRVQKRHINEFVEFLFRVPQLRLSARNIEDLNPARVDFLSILAIKLLSEVPVSMPTMRVDPIYIKLGFKFPWKYLRELDNESLNSIIKYVSDEQTGVWSVVNDILIEKNAWRLAWEFRPTYIKDLHWFDAEKREILCVTIDGVGLFMKEPDVDEFDKS